MRRQLLHLRQSTTLPAEWAHNIPNAQRGPNLPLSGCYKRVRLDRNWFGIPEKPENPGHPGFANADITQKTYMQIKWEFRDSTYIFVDLQQ